MIDAVADALGIARKPGLDLANEQVDIHEIDRLLGSVVSFDEALRGFSELSRDAQRGGHTFGLSTAEQAQFMGRPKKLWTIKGMGAVWDYRGFTVPNGGTIKPLVHVEHIPVIRQMAGRADLDTLWRVLVSQGLMVHNGSDGEGNVALYTNLNRLNYHAKGVNSYSVGTEHMHLTTADSWSNRQINAAAYLSFRSWEYAGLTTTNGILGSGSGYATVRKRGHVTHERVSAAAGYYDRSDPGPKYEALMREIAERAQHYNKYHKF